MKDDGADDVQDNAVKPHNLVCRVNGAPRERLEVYLQMLDGWALAKLVISRK